LLLAAPLPPLASNDLFDGAYSLADDALRVSEFVDFVFE
jgi:hypothetical protein